MPSKEPSDQPSFLPSVSTMPSFEPSVSLMPTVGPSIGPSISMAPTNKPSISILPTVSQYPTPSPTARKVFEEGFTSRDIGSVGRKGGSSNPESGLHVVQGSGSDIYGYSDAFHYMFVETSGDVTFTALVENFAASTSWAKTGIMFRGSLSSASSHYSVFLTRSQGIANQYRTCTACSTYHAQSWMYTPSSVWLKVTKVGNVLTAYYRPTTSTSSTWYQFGVSLSMVNIRSTGFYVGIAVTSRANWSLATAEVSNIQLTRVCTDESITEAQCEQASNCELGGLSSTCYYKGTKPAWEDGYAYEGSFVASVLDEGSTIAPHNCDSGASITAVDRNTNKFHCARYPNHLTETPGIIASPSHGQLSIVNGLRLYNPNQYPGGDPTEFKIQGRTLYGSIVRDKWDNLCWEVKGPEDGFKVVPSACDASNPLQLFYATPLGAIHVKGLPGKCLDDPGSLKDLYFFDCHLEANQRWEYDAASQRERNVGSSNCIDYNHNTGYLWSHACHGGANQKFYWQEETWHAAPGTGVTMQERHSNNCMKVKSSGDRYEVESDRCDSSKPEQLFYLTPDRLIKTNKAPDLCLDVALDSSSQVYFGGCHGGKNQQWKYDPATQRLYTLLDGSCLDYNYDTRLLMRHACHDGNNQKWSFGSDSFFSEPSWKDIAAGPLVMNSVERNAQGLPITSTYESGDKSKFFTEVSFLTNVIPYSEYRYVELNKYASSIIYLQPLTFRLHYFAGFYFQLRDRWMQRIFNLPRLN
jgi:hypothetical protein